MEYNATAQLGELPGSLATRQSASHYMNQIPMIPHGSRITAFGVGCVWTALGLGAVVGCARRGNPEPASLTADQEWVQSVCLPASPDTTGWPRYQLGNMSIAVPPEYRRGRTNGFSLRFSRGTSTLTVMLGRQSAFTLLGYNRPGQVVCEADYGGFPTEALSWNGRGEYLAIARWDRLNEPDARPSVQAMIRTTRLRDAQALRLALHTIQRSSSMDAAEPVVNADAWFHAPCAGDSVDSFEWTRFDLRAVRIRVPRDIRRVEFPDPSELHFRKGRATLRLRLHNDASSLVSRYIESGSAYRTCQGEMAGLAVEALSFRESTRGSYGFAARWADADRGEWLGAVITAPTLAEATALRRALLTLQFPGTRRR